MRATIFLMLSMMAPALAVLATLAVPSAAHAQADEEGGDDDEARMHFRLGRAYYDSGRFQEAAHEFQQAFDLSHRPALLYNIFVAHRDAGELEQALTALRDYLQRVPDAPERERLIAQRDALARTVASQVASSASSSTSTTSTRTTSTGTSTSTSTTTSEPDATMADTHDDGAESHATDIHGDGHRDGDDHRDAHAQADENGGGLPLVPIVVMGAGGALVIGGLVTGLLALDAQSSLEGDCDATFTCPAGFEGTRDSGKALALTTDILIGVGAAAIATGAVLLFVMGGEPDDEDPHVACGPFGCSVSGRF